MLKMQLLLIWVAVGSYVIASCLAIGSTMFNQIKWVKWSYFMGWVGLIPQTAALLLRWNETGHFPYWGSYEVLTSYAWAAAILLHAFAILMPKHKVVIGWLWPFIFLMLGLGVMGTKDIKDIPRTFYTFWLGVHILFAKLAYGSALLSAGIGAMYLWRRSKNENDDLQRLDQLNYSLSGFAFVMLGIMILSGAIWAYKAWGAYWRWDPIETWALISWLVYGIGLHLRFSWGWKGKKAAILSIFALALIIFAFFGIPLIYPTVHEHLTY